MPTLSEDLETLRQLNEYRYKAKEMREQSLYALKKIEKISDKDSEERENIQFPYISSKEDKEGPKIDFERWVASSDKVEAALLAKVQAHRDLSKDEKKNNEPRTQTNPENNLIGLSLDELLIPVGRSNKETSVKIPVLVAARVMQSLLNRAETVFEKATMRCYYRIIRELYGVAQPNWTVGAARAGIGGTTSAFVTNECIRAIFAFENTLDRTFEFLKQTHIFYKKYSELKKMINDWNIQQEDNHPLYIWINETIKIMWLDCALSTNPRNREIALFHPKDQNKNKNINDLLLPDDVEIINFESAEEYFDSLPQKLESAIERLFQNVAHVYAELLQHRQDEYPHPVIPIDIKKKNENEFELLGENENYTFNENKELNVNEENWRKEEHFIRSATAHAFALKVIEDSVIKSHKLKQAFFIKDTDDRKETGDLLEDLYKQFYKIKRRVHRVLEPSKQYLKWVINRELAAPKETFDAGELVFAATSYGAITNWQIDTRLNRVCELLVNSLPDNGRLPTKRPFRTDYSGYRLIPIGCEMTRALANLLQKTGYNFDENFVRKMFGLFNENSIELHESTAEKKLIAWNFEGAPDPDKPSVWVTATTVIALDRIIRMLNARINEIVLRHFDVTTCERPHTKMTLHDLIYSDYGLAQWYEGGKKIGNFTALNLQLMRAHIMRATLPKKYQNKDEKNFSAIFYGPPGTGKTTLAESLALSSKVSLVKLSPSDLILQGQELIEGRARDVFEALAMLTQCVIIFDEFEPVLKNRKKDDILISRKDDFWEMKGIDYDTMRMSEAIQRISQRDDPKFRFVLSGMLPKFGKLHDAAESQSFVYCMGTNIFKDIDEAAKRPGRFDKYFPVYKPDPLSRAGLLLYRLSLLGLSMTSKNSTQIQSRIQSLISIIALTANQDANLLNKTFKVPTERQSVNKRTKIDTYLNEIIKNAFRENPSNRITSTKIEEMSAKNIEALSHDLKHNAYVDDDEKYERAFFIQYEKDFAKALKIRLNNPIIDSLESYLSAEVTNSIIQKERKDSAQKSY